MPATKAALPEGKRGALTGAALSDEVFDSSAVFIAEREEAEADHEFELAA